MAKSLSSSSLVAVIFALATDEGARATTAASRKGAFAAGPVIAATSSDLAPVWGAATGAVAAAVRPRVSDGGNAEVMNDLPARSGGTCRGGSLSAAATVVVGGIRVGTSTMRRSGASTRRSCHGKPKPGSPSPWPPKVRLNSSECSSRESSSAMVSGLRCALMCWLGDGARLPGPEACVGPGEMAGACMAPGSIESKPAPLPWRAFWNRAGRPPALCSRADDLRCSARRPS